ncbi:hypothetical protein PR048_010582 [Dryococelus australis]|uniref:Uncharacterized protein n=1 Tax=Dryococelus australis TaxID=614101 RepID=A0ABQ9I363_9NEOP|nr:hypothetical protein PR048_010582 [Dryococelus australis]
MDGRDSQRAKKFASSLTYLCDATMREKQFCKDHVLLSVSTKANRVQPSTGSPDFRKWESCRTKPLVGGFFSWGSPVSPASSFRRHTIFASITLIGSQDLVVKSHPNLFPPSPPSFSISFVKTFPTLNMIILFL